MSCEAETLKALEDLHHMVTMTEYAFTPQNVMAAVIISRKKGNEK